MNELQVTTPAIIFYSYAQEDELLCKELEKHLSSLRRQGIITEWNDHKIVAGTNREDVINTHLNMASIILLLISPDFLMSDYCFGVEMQKAMERHDTGDACVIPIILRPVDWQGTPFANLQCLPHNTKPVTSWDNLDEAFLDIVDGLHKAIENMSGQSIQSHLLSPSLRSNVPYPRNPYFTGREDLLLHIASCLNANQTAAITQAQAISGLGGIGKTQIALEYAYRYRSLYQEILWVQAETHEALVSSFVSIAQLLHLEGKDGRDQNIIVKEVIKWMQTHTMWLLILDNSDNLSIVQTFIPPIFGGHILLTTRAQAMGRLAKRIEVETMAPEVGALFLLRRATIIPSDALLEQTDIAHHEMAMRIVQELGGLPLALDQAGAYIEETHCGLDDYLKIYQVHRSALLRRRGGFVADHPIPVATTWLISFKHIEQNNPAAVELLRFCAFLYPDMIPEEILTEGIGLLEEQFHVVATDTLIFNETLGILCAYSFVRRDMVNHTLSIHRLVQAVLKDDMSTEAYQQWAERAVYALNKVFPRVTVNSWAQCERYLTNAQVCATHIEEHDIAFPEAAYSLNNIGWYLKERGQYEIAEPFLLRSLMLRERVLGIEHPDTAKSLNSLGSLSVAQGKYEKAEQYHKRALAIREKYLGLEHSDTAVSLNNLAWVCYVQGKYHEAEAFYIRSLTIFKQSLGTEHHDTMIAMTNLAWLYYKQAKYIEAEQLYIQILAIQEKHMQTADPNIARTMNNLALLYTTHGRYDEAGPLHKQAHAHWERFFGPEHPETMMSLTNLAFFYFQQEEYNQAELLYTRALTIREQRLGAEHPDTAKSLFNLARLHYAQDRYMEAEQLYTRALAIMKQKLGEHPETAACLSGLAQLYDTLDKDSLAEIFFTQAMALRERYLGKAHPDTISTSKNYVKFLRKLGKEAEADQLEVSILSLSSS